VFPGAYRCHRDGSVGERRGGDADGVKVCPYKCGLDALEDVRDAQFVGSPAGHRLVGIHDGHQLSLSDALAKIIGMHHARPAGPHKADAD
jgi:hypothetical protein